MNELVERLAGALVTEADDLAREFEARLADSSTLAFRVAFSVLRQRQDAEDVAQDAFARAYRRFSDLRDRERFRGWLVRVTWRLAIDFRRAERRRSARENSAARLADGSVHGERLAIEGERSSRLWHTIDALPDKLRIVVVLQAIEGHGVADIARLLDIPEGTVKSRLFDARKRLRESFPHD
jgi:RNA polymerase sigma-70 factor (ECF subfamily)